MDEDYLLEDLEPALLPEAAAVWTMQDADTPRVVNPMALTATERAHALAIKAAVAQRGDIPPLTDYQYAHHALVDDTVELAVRKIEGMQLFRQQYGIDDTVEQGVYYLNAFMNQQKGFLLHLDVCENNWESIRVLDVSKLNPHAAMAVCPQNGVDYHWKQFVCGQYYLHTACSPSLASIRQGVFELADLGELSQHNLSMEFEYRRHGELIGNYPFKFKTIMAYNTGYWANVSWNLMKPMLNENMRTSIQLGCQVVDDDGGCSNRRLAEFYLQPNLEMAQQSVVHRAQTMLQIRRDNEQVFSLI